MIAAECCGEKASGDTKPNLEKQRQRALVALQMDLKTIIGRRGAGLAD